MKGEAPESHSWTGDPSPDAAPTGEAGILA